MHQIAFYLATAWMTVLLVVSVGAVIGLIEATEPPETETSAPRTG